MRYQPPSTECGIPVAPGESYWPWQLNPVLLVMATTASPSGFWVRWKT
jgi:hypothetical protein